MLSSVMEGDLIYGQAEDEAGYYLMHVLKVGSTAEGTRCYHVRCYGPVPELPHDTLPPDTPVAADHAVLEADLLDTECSFFAHRSLTDADKQAYYTYLKATDFRRYVRESGISVDRLVAEAQQYFQAGQARETEGDWHGAILSYQRAVDIYPLYYQALTQAGLCRLNEDQSSEARALFSRALAISDRYALAWYGLGLASLQERDFITAQEQLARALQLAPADPAIQICYVRATLYNRPDELRKYAGLLYEQMQLADARELLLRYVELRPTDREARQLLAQIEEWQAKFADQAAAMVETAQTLWQGGQLRPAYHLLAQYCKRCPDDGLNATLLQQWRQDLHPGGRAA